MNEKKQLCRLFVASDLLKIDGLDRIREHVCRQINEILEPLDQKIQPQMQLHITFAFIGEVVEQKIALIHDALIKAAIAFVLHTRMQHIVGNRICSGVRFIGSSNAIGVEVGFADGLHDLVKEIKKQLTAADIIFDAEKAFLPHITLGYVPDMNEHYKKELALALVQMHTPTLLLDIDRFSLYRSENNQYTIVHTYEL